MSLFVLIRLIRMEFEERVCAYTFSQHYNVVDRCALRLLSFTHLSRLRATTINRRPMWYQDEVEREGSDARIGRVERRVAKRCIQH